MKNKKMLLTNIPFVVFSTVILIISLLDLVNIKIGVILIFICLGCQQLFNGLRLYKEDKKLGLFHILFGLGFLVFTLWLVLKIYFFT